MNKAVEYLRKLRNRSSSYFHENCDEITRYNVGTLLLTSIRIHFHGTGRRR
ncbi:MAG: hypothetical protein PHT39_07825 [Sphaerochaetaceae bacterium]|nr:hypothetical protein [Sphaerochaetaceae bacterium]